jgi:hypothetical protein
MFPESDWHWMIRQYAICDRIAFTVSADRLRTAIDRLRAFVLPLRTASHRGV